ncbi:MAG: ACT domain-containing protein, partial [Phycisphaerae bacterium]|nr:ACT domain-containing protein [Phycisphaerae bacterium]
NLAGILGEHGVSIASVIQHESIDAERVPLIIMTHRAREEMVQQAISKVRGLDVMRGETVCIRVLDSDTSRGTGE